MHPKGLLTFTSICLMTAGVLALFAPDIVLGVVGTAPTAAFLTLVQLMGALYFGFALMDWAAKDSAIGGIYARPVSLGNFAHFFIGTLLLARHQLSAPFTPLMLILLLAYTLFAGLFYWLVFRSASGPAGANH